MNKTQKYIATCAAIALLGEFVYGAAPAIALLGEFVCGAARAERVAPSIVHMIKTVPEGASVQFLVRGEVVQSMSLRAGSYEITVREIR